MTSYRVVGWALVLAAACGGSQDPPPPRRTTPPLCSVGARSTSTGGAAVRNLRPAQWFELLLGRRDGGATRDCTGAPIAFEEPRDRRWRCIEPPPESYALPRRRLTENDLVISRVTSTQRLVWAITQRYSNGEGVGPVALAQFTDDGVEIRAIGTLRARTRRARLRLMRTGSYRMLMAEGEICTRPSEPATCRRAARVLPLRRGRFQNVPLVREDGRCIGPAHFHMSRDEVITLDSGWNRRFQLTTMIRFANGGFSVHEQVIVSDTDPRHPAVPPRLFRRTAGERFVRMQRGRLIASDTSLWHRTTVLRASVRVPLRYRRDGGVDGGGDAAQAQR